ncbi:MAG: dihydrolipoyl dehydrogenase [Planctomycetaceae bacterium]|nr:dihydrolipoyl dehydrogenase [Planctomycetaceae bacterium]
MYDLIIIGAGPAGYVAAEHAGADGRKVLLVERDVLGGVCLNRGCVPTKAFLHAAKTYDHARHGGVFGVTAKGVEFDYPVMKARTEKVQEQLRNGIAGLMKRGKVRVVTGDAVIRDRNTVTVAGADYAGKNLLIATGSRPAVPPIPGLKDNPKVVDSTGILQQPTLAESVVVIGGGVIGIEFACFFTLLGKKVTVVEILPQLCGNADKEAAMTIQKRLESQGAAIHLGATVERVDGGTVHFKDRAGAAQSAEGEIVLVAAGRVANLDGFGLENLNLDADRRRISVNDRAETSVPGVYAAGDVTGRWPLAHFASRQTLVAVNNMFGRDDICRETAIPAVVYTDPEIASVGLTDVQAKERGLDHRVVKMPLGASGRFLAETDGVRGFVKAVLGGRDELLGMHVVGPYASEMIGAACVMIENELRARDITEIVFPHPTVAEIMKEVMFQ